MLYWLCLSEFWCREDTWRLLSHLVFAEHCFSPWCIFTWENYQGMLFRSVHQIGFLYVLPTKFILVCDFWSVSIDIWYAYPLNMSTFIKSVRLVSLTLCLHCRQGVSQTHHYMWVCYLCPPHLFFKEFLLSSNHKISGCVLGLKVFHS